MKRAILPARPLRLRGGAYVKAALLALFMLALAGVAVLGTTWFVSSAATIGRDKDVWARGVPAEGGHFEGERRSKLGLAWFVASYDGTVSYTDAAGARYEGSVNFWTMFGGPDTDRTELRYDPDHPERFAISWAVEASGARWRAVVVMTLLLVLIAILCGVGAWAFIDDVRHRARIAATGDEVALRVVSADAVVREGKPTGKVRYELELADRQFTVEMPSVLPCAPADAAVLGLWLPGKPRSVLVLARDLAPLAVSHAERMQVLDRAVGAVTDTRAAAPSA